MAFFDDFGKKVTQMGQGAAAKAKNMTDQAKLHSQVNEEEKKITDNYRKIGELFYSVRGGEDLPEYQTLMEEIDAAKAAIVDLNHQLQVARGMIECPECGAEVSINAVFCPKCGARMLQPKAEEQSAPEESPAAEEAPQESQTAEEAPQEE